MITLYKNYIIWLEREEIRLISDDKIMRLQLEIDREKPLAENIQAMIRWINQLEATAKKLSRKK